MIYSKVIFAAKIVNRRFLINKGGGTPLWIFRYVF